MASSLSRNGFRLSSLLQKQHILSSASRSIIQRHMSSSTPLYVANGPKLQKALANGAIGQPHAVTHPHLLRPDELTRGITFDEFKQRRSRFASQLPPNSVCVIPGNPTRWLSNDIPIPWRQDSMMHYLCGFQEPNGILMFARGAQSSDISTYLFTEPKNEREEMWTGTRTGVEAASELFEVDDAFPFNQLETVLQQHLEAGKSLFLDPAANSEITKRIEQLFKVHGYDYAPRNPQKMLWKMRLIKSEAECNLMRKAGKIAGEAFAHVVRGLQPGMTEHQVGSWLEFEFKIRGAQRCGYPCVVAAGKNALTLHYIELHDTLRPNDLLLIDAGCEYQLYNSDISRTYPISGKFTPAQRAVYDAVLACQLKCIAACVPGASINSLQVLAKQELVNSLFDLGIFDRRSISVEEVMRKGMYGFFYPHNIGHSLGMDVHDDSMSNIATSANTNHAKLEPGMIITIEPGLYIPDHPAISEHYRNIGIRIEDDILIGKDGKPEVLTALAPKDPDEIERLMAEGSLKDSIGHYVQKMKGIV